MTIQINGTSGISGVDGSAGTPAIQGTDTNTGISFGTDEVNINTGGITRATVDSSGRVGIGATPASWDPDSGLSAIQLNGYGAIWNYYNNVQLAFNAYQSATGDKYLTADNAAKYTLDSGGNHVWYTASSGSANGAITWSERARIDSSGNVGIGVAGAPGSLLHLAATGTSTNAEIIIAGTNTNGDPSCQARIGATQDGALTSGALTFSTRLSGTTSERARITSTGNFQFNSGYGSVATAYGCRAWVNFDGTGTVAIRASGNVSSITDNATGDYTVNFTTAMPDTRYCAVASSRTPSSTAIGCMSPVTYNTGSVRVFGSGEIVNASLNYVGANFNTDHVICNVAIFR